jgi:hypothetical protein
MIGQGDGARWPAADRAFQRVGGALGGLATGDVIQVDGREAGAV